MLKLELPLKVSIKQSCCISLEIICFLLVENTNETENPMVTPTVITADEAFAAAGLSQEGEMKEIVAPFAELTQDLWNAQVVVGGSLVDNIDPNSLTEGNVSFKCNAA